MRSRRILGVAEGRLLATTVAIAILVAACGGEGAGDTPATTQAPPATTNDTAASATTSDTAVSATTPTTTSGDVVFEEVHLQIAHWLGPEAPAGEMLQWWADEVSERTGGAVTAEIFYGGALLGGPDILAGVRDGLADGGAIGFGYYQDLLPLSQVAGLPFRTRDVEAVLRAYRAMYEQNELYAAEFASQGVVPMMSLPLGSNMLGSSVPVETVDQLESLRIRGYGYINDALDAVGAVPVGLDAGDIYEAMERGTIDAWSGNALEVIPDIGLHEVTPHIVDTGYGVYASLAFGVSEGVWNSMQPELQDVIRQINEDSVAVSLETLAKYEQSACEEIKASGATVSVLADEEVDKWEDAIGTSIDDKWVETTSATGGLDESEVQGFVDEYLNLLADFEGQSSYVPGSLVCAGVEG